MGALFLSGCIVISFVIGLVFFITHFKNKQYARKKVEADLIITYLLSTGFEESLEYTFHRRKIHIKLWLENDEEMIELRIGNNETEYLQYLNRDKLVGHLICNNILTKS